MLRIENLRAGYGKSEALHGVSVSIGAGKVVALIGANGAGKSTLVNTISRLLPVGSGLIEFEGRDVTSLSAADMVELGVIQERAQQRAATLSGGEQQMVAMGRALMAEPRLLLLDEPSLGLAPIIIDRVFETLERLRNEGLTMLLVEQRADSALSLSDYAYVMATGEISAEGKASDIRLDERVQKAYLGEN